MSAAPAPDEEARGPFLEGLELAALHAAVAAVGRIPAARAVRLGAALGALSGELARRLGARQHRIAALNLEIAFPELSPERRDALRRAMWRNWGRVLVEIARLARADAGTLRALVRLDPPAGAAEIFRRARHGGAIVLTAHFGSFEMLHAGCAAHGFPITLVHRTLPNRRADRWRTDLRARLGSRVLRRGAAAREILRELRDGRVVALPFDQRPPAGASVYAPFFSLSPTTSSGVARLALASRAPVFPVVLVREGESPRHRAVFEPEVPLVRTGDREADILENTRRMNRALEALVRRHPDHWIWMYGRWKRLPGGLPSPYRSGSPPLEVYRRAAREARDIGLGGAPPDRGAPRPPAAAPEASDMARAGSAQRGERANAGALSQGRSATSGDGP